MIMGSLPLSTAVSLYMTLTLIFAMSCNCLHFELDDSTFKVPALFVFGDSLLDTGNNDGLLTIARAASPPYGEDMGSKNGSSSTGGRFSNGLITTDFIAASVKLPCPPTYVSAGDNIERGVNFASAATGILDDTGNTFGQHFSMGMQIKNFQDVKDRLKQKVGSEVSSSIISKAIFYITTGSNDFLISYYSMPPNPVYALLSPAQFSDLLISKFNDQLTSLYELGARKFAVTSIPPVGCTPYAFERYPNRARDGDDGCISFMNDDAQTYNKKLFSSIQTLQDLFPDAHFIYNDAYKTAVRVYKNHSAYGITNVKDACCDSQGGKSSVMPSFCAQSSHVCANASQYFFFDAFHPTSTVHSLTALIYVEGTPPFVSPFNLKTLASLP